MTLDEFVALCTGGMAPYDYQRQIAEQLKGLTVRYNFGS